MSEYPNSTTDGATQSTEQQRYEELSAERDKYRSLLLDAKFKLDRYRDLLTECQYHLLAQVEHGVQAHGWSIRAAHLREKITQVIDRPWPAEDA